MISFPSTLSTAVDLKPQRFPRRALLPLKSDYLWRIEMGVVRTVTWLEDGTTITLGLWGAGDIAGKMLIKGEPYQIECLSKVEVTLLPLNELQIINQAMCLHIQRLQEFFEILHSRPLDVALMRFLNWLAKRFGTEITQGKMIDIRLTHQEIAEIIGATRVTVTRMLKEFEHRGIIQRLPHGLILLQEDQPFWHYEI